MTTHPSGTVLNPFCKDQSRRVQEKFLLTAMCVAGKKATVQQSKVDDFCNIIQRELPKSYPSVTLDTPIFQALGALPPGNTRDGYISALLKRVKMGQYTRLTRGIKEVIQKMQSPDFDIDSLDREDLTDIHGIGMKTASYWLLYAQGKPYAVLDRHVLSWLHERRGVTFAVTPQSVKSYLDTEEVFMHEMNSLGLTDEDIADFDFKLWLQYSENNIPPQ